ncbi:MAG: hypothetical protein ABIF77_21945, partial [bacterium]
GDFEEYTTGGETYRRYMQWTRIEIAGGERLGTAHGAWFNPGSPNGPEDPHLALVQSHTRPSRLAICLGTSLTTIGSGAYMFTPQDAGRLNRAFADITADGLVYGFHVPWPEVTFIVQMPAADRLWIETLAGTLSDPAEWVFTAAKVEFVR